MTISTIQFRRRNTTSFCFFNELDDRGLDGNAGKNAMPQMSASTVMNRDELKGVNAELEAPH